MSASQFEEMSVLARARNNRTTMSAEELYILEQFGQGEPISGFTATVVLSRVLTKRYIQHVELTSDEQALYDGYVESISGRGTALLDEKFGNRDRETALSAEQEQSEPRAPQVPPTNDTCVGAVVIPPTGPFPFLTAPVDLTDATESLGDPMPSCQTAHSRNIWYTFTPTTTGTYVLTTCRTTASQTTRTDTILGVYTSTGGCAGPFTQVACNDDDSACSGATLQSTVSTTLTSGTTYYVVIWSFDAPAPPAGASNVQLAIITTPSNDTCASPTPLTLNVPQRGSMLLATNTYQVSGAACFTGVGQTANAGAGRDVVYSFTAPSAGSYSFRVWAWSGSTNPMIYTATTCPAGTPPITVACTAAANRNTTTANGAEEITCQALTAGQQVFLFVDEVTTASTANVSFFVEVLPCVSEVEANGTTATANAVACGIQGGTTPAGDVDFYSLGTPAAGSRVFAMVDSAPGNNTDQDLRVTTATDTLEYDDANNAPLFGSLGPNVAGARTTGVPTFLRVNHFSGTNTEPYRLFSAIQPPGAGAFGSSATNETEPNNTAGTANTAANNYFYGTVASTTDLDFYAFEATAGDTVFLSLDSDPSRVTGTAGSQSPIDGILFIADSVGAPAGFAILGVDDTGTTTSITSGAGSLTATTPNAPAEALVFHVPTSGIYYAVVNIFSGTGDYLLSISKNCAVGGGIGPADLAVTKTDSPDPVIAGSNITYTITATNNGPSTALNVNLSDAVPAGTTFVSFAQTGGPTATLTSPAVGGTGTASASIPSLASGASATFTMVVAVSASAANNSTVTNTATIAALNTDPTPANNSATATTTVVTQADLAVTKTDSPDPVSSGSNLTYTISLTNNGPNGADSVSLTDTVPANTTFVSFTQNTGPSFTISAPAVGGTGTITATVASLPSGGSATFTFVVNVGASVPNGTIITNTAMATSATTDPTAGNNSATATTTVMPQADLSITKSDSPDPIVTGQNVTYTLTVSNAGPSDSTGVTVTDTLPANLTFVSCNSTGGGTCGGSGNARTVSFTSIPAGGSATITFVATVNCNVANGTVITNTATVAATTADGNPANNSATATTTASNPVPTITCPANISVPATTTQGDQTGAIVTYTATATDNCPSPTVVCTPASGSFFPTGTTTVTCTATDAGGGSASCSFTVTVGVAFTNCIVDDATGNTLSIVADPTSPIYGFWRLTVVSPAQTFTGTAESVTFIPRRSLTAYDHDSRSVRMDLSITYSSNTATATVRVLGAATTYTLRDRNVTDDPPCQ